MCTLDFLGACVSVLSLAEKEDSTYVPQTVGNTSTTVFDTALARHIGEVRIVSQLNVCEKDEHVHRLLWDPTSSILGVRMTNQNSIRLFDVRAGQMIGVISFSGENQLKDFALSSSCGVVLL